MSSPHLRSFMPARNGVLICSRGLLWLCACNIILPSLILKKDTPMWRTGYALYHWRDLISIKSLNMPSRSGYRIAATSTAGHEEKPHRGSRVFHLRGIRNSRRIEGFYLYWQLKLRSTHTLLSSSFWGLPYRVLNINHKKEPLRSIQYE